MLNKLAALHGVSNRYELKQLLLVVIDIYFIHTDRVKILHMDIDSIEKEKRKRTYFSWIRCYHR